MRNLQLHPGEFYHIFNRGTEKRKIFMENSDYYRFIISLTSFNQQKRLSKRSINRINKIPDQLSGQDVNIHSYCLMPNHYHLLLEQLTDNGVSEFMHRVGMGYAKYFNKKYDRTGILFESKFKAKHVKTTEYLLQLSKYIHLNPLELLQPDRKKTGIYDWDQAKPFLDNYEWSSLPIYLDHAKHNFVKKSKILANFTTVKQYIEFLQE